MSGATRTPAVSPAVPLAAVLAGAAVSVALGVYGHAHTPAATGYSYTTLVAWKVWLALVVGVLALSQLVTALWLYGRLPRPAPPWLGTAHRAGGVLAVLVSLPIAYNCLYRLGFQSYDGRVLLHSLAGCLFYGALVTKVLVLRSRSAPGWALPVAGGVLFTVVVAAVLTSAGWSVATQGAP